jgi:hypothetical protein
MESDATIIKTRRAPAVHSTSGCPWIITLLPSTPRYVIVQQPLDPRPGLQLRQSHRLFVGDVGILPCAHLRSQRRTVQLAVLLVSCPAAPTMLAEPVRLI